MMQSSLISKILERLTQENLALEWYSGKRILVTGGAGFIGSWLVEALVRLGADVYIVDNLWRGSLENFKREDGSSWIPLSDHFFLGDLQEYHIALSACIKSKPDIIFHLADIVAGIDYVFANEPFLFRANNLINSNLFTAAKEAGVLRLVYLGTACSYPKKLQEKPGGIPLVEDQVYPADPESAYGWSKLMGEYEIELLAKYSDMQVGILRLQNVYGPRAILSKKRSQVIPSLIRKAVRYPEEDFIVWGSGKQARDFVFVGDVIDAILRLTLKGMDKGPIQIGTAQETTVAELASKIVAISGKDIPIIFDNGKPEGDGGRSGNFNKARLLLGWDVFTPLEDGLKQTYDWAALQIKNHKVNFEE
jgi:GDP-D-mannose 3',5'-epimerase